MLLILFLFFAQAEPREVALGQSLAAPILAEAKRPVDATAAAYFRTLAPKIAPLRWQLIDLPSRAEPIVLPGALVLVPQRAFLAVESEAEFAALLVHAAAHAQLRHGVDPADAAATPNGPTIYRCPWLGCHTATQGAPLTVPRAWISSLRDDELAADKLGLELAARAGFAPSAWQRYVEREQSELSAPATLPVKRVRLEAIAAALPALQPDLPASATPGNPSFTRAQESVRAALARPGVL